MARIKREDHARILNLVDHERRPVREIAAEFGCTPAAIYVLLTKLRRAAAGAAPAPSETQAPLELEDDIEAEVAAAVPISTPVSSLVSAPTPVLAPAPVQVSVPASPSGASAGLPQQERRVVTFERAAPTPAREETKRPAASPVGGKLAKPGMGLLMRTPDGEETMTPFRSLDDLLSAIKPILRAGARSPDPVWFSLQPVDLSTIDVDAA